MFGNRQSVLAVDIGSSAIKILELGTVRGKPAVLNVGAVSVASAEADEQKGANEVNQGSALSQLLASLRINPRRVRNVVSALPGPQVGLKQIRTLKLEPDELRSSLVFEARKHMPVKGEVLLDFQVMGENGDSLDVLLVVTTREAVEQHHRILSYAGLRPGVIEAPALAQVNAVLLTDGGVEGKDLATIHVGAGTTHVCLRTAGGHLLSREIPVAGNAFTEDLRRDRQVDFAEAERLKIEQGAATSAPAASDNGDEAGLRLALASKPGGRALESLTRELQRSIRFFMKEAGCSRIDATVLSGGAVEDRSLRDHLERELRLPQVVADPFDQGGIRTDLRPEKRAQYVQAAGMALRGLNDLLSN